MDKIYLYISEKSLSLHPSNDKLNKKTYMKLKVQAFLLIILGLFIITITGCKRKEAIATPTPTPNPTNIKFLGHKGAGDNVYEDLYMELTTPSFQEALADGMEGVEIDAQMSLDGTIWLIHDAYMTNIWGLPHYNPCLYNLHDNQIEQIQLCDTVNGNVRHDRIYKMSELISQWNNTPGGFYLDMEIKQADLDPELDTTINVTYGSMDTYLFQMADQFNDLLSTRNHPDSMLMFEVDDTTFCSILRSRVPGAKFFLFRYGFTSLQDYANTAKALGYDGITESFSNSYVNAAGVSYARNLGMIVQLWDPYSHAELNSTFAMNPNFIQTDNMDCKKDLNVQ